MLRVLAFLAAVLIGADAALAAPRTILAFGDSLFAGYGLPPEDAFPAQLEAALRAGGHDVRIVDAGVSGDTAAQGLDRLDWALAEGVDAAIVELGGNDALRGLPPAETERALDAILKNLAGRGLPVLVAGMKAPRNLGPDYAAAFDAIYPRLAERHGALLYPFLLDGVAAVPALNQPDGLHPNREGIAVIVARILPSIEGLLAKVAAK
jgi:acyl-CoA thioesterase-1